jgi:hypothetical protein
MGVLTGNYRVTFDAASLARFAALTNAPAIMTPFYTAAMNASVNYVVTQAKMRAPVKTGTLRRGITGYTLSPWRGVVGVSRAVPYARRREYGFDAQTDRLGRYYPLDPIDPALRAHMFYLKRGLEASYPFIEGAFSTAAHVGLRTLFI